MDGIKDVVSLRRKSPPYEQDTSEHLVVSRKYEVRWKNTLSSGVRETEVSSLSVATQ
jgi:hypothetical protein